MKNRILVMTAALLAAGGMLQSANAGEKGRYLIGGLVGGWVLNEAFDQPRHSHSVHLHSTGSSCTPRVVVRTPRCETRARSNGHYEIRREKVWVRGYHERVKQPCGRIVKEWVPGHYEYREEKVWVSHEPSRRVRSRSGNRVSYSHWR